MFREPPNPFDPSGHNPRNQASKDPTEAVEVLPTVDGYRLDKVGQWRYDRLITAGYTESQALMLAIARHIDLHKAVDLAHAAGPDMAYQIVS